MPTASEAFAAIKSVTKALLYVCAARVAPAPDQAPIRYI